LIFFHRQFTFDQMLHFVVTTIIGKQNKFEFIIQTHH
jgi:hypothetical protein